MIGVELNSSIEDSKSQTNVIPSPEHQDYKSHYAYLPCVLKGVLTRLVYTLFKINPLCVHLGTHKLGIKQPYSGSLRPNDWSESVL